MTHRAPALLVVALAFALPAAAARSTTDTVAFLHVDVVPMDSERVLTDQTVLVRDGRIAALGAASEVRVPKRTRIVDAAGHFLVPGLIDTEIRAGDRSPDLRYLIHGVTTVVIAGDDRPGPDDREPVEGDEPLAPTVLTPGPEVDLSTLTTAGDLVAWFRPAGTTRFRIFRALAWWLQSFLWVSVVGWAVAVWVRYVRRLVPPERPRALVVARWLTLVVVVSAATLFLLFAVATPGDPTDDAKGGVGGMIVVAVIEALATGALWFLAVRAWKDRSVPQVHRIHLLAVTAAAVVLATSTLYWIPLARRSSDAGLTELAAATRESGTRVIPGLVTYREQDPVFVERLVASLHRSGVPLVLGTGAMGADITPGASVSEELALLVALGLSPYEALRTATVEPARFLGLAGEIGSFEVGARADLVLLARNPLDDVTSVRRPLGVVIRGRWLDPERLDDLIREISAGF
jgi:hypothetical protein